MLFCLCFKNVTFKNVTKSSPETSMFLFLSDLVFFFLLQILSFLSYLYSNFVTELIIGDY